MTPEVHGNDGLEELIADIDILIAEELDLAHRFGRHPRPAEACEWCVRVIPTVGRRPPVTHMKPGVR